MRLRINDQIQAPQIHLIDEQGESLGVVSRDQALVLAYEKGLDVVEVSPLARPPVAKLADYGKYLYAIQKKEQRQKSHQKETTVKEIRLSFKIDPHDLQTKRNKALDFLNKGHKVKVFLTLRGREKAFSIDAVQKIEQFIAATGAAIETLPKQLGNTISAIIVKK